MKKKLMIIFIFILSFVIVSCGPSNTETLRVINFRVEDQDYYEWLVEKFESENPGVKIEYDSVDTDNYPQLMGARIASGDVDVIYVEPHNVFDGSISGNLLELENLSMLGKMEETVLNTGKLYFPELKRSKQLIVPLNKTGSIVFYNKTFFDTKSIEVPKDWNSFISLLNQVDGFSEVESPIIYGGREQWPSNIILNAVESQIINNYQPDFYEKIRDWENEPDYRFNNQYWLETFEKTNEIFGYFQRNSTGLSYSNVPGLFVVGNPQTKLMYPMMIDGSWSAAQILLSEPEFEVGSFILPANDIAENNKFLPYKPGTGLSIFKHSKNPELAKEFIEFNYREDNYKKYLEDTLFGSVLLDVPQENELIKNIFSDSYEPIMLAENRIVPGMPWESSAGLTNMILGILSPQELANSINSNIEKQYSNWIKNIEMVNVKDEE